MWGGGCSISWRGQGSFHERARLTTGPEEVRMLAKLGSGGRAFAPRRGSSCCTGCTERVCPAWEGVAGETAGGKEDGRAGGKEVPG